LTKPGKESTEHARASRAEGAAFALLVAGLVLAVLGALSSGWISAAVGVLLAAAGASLLASVNHSYAQSRGGVKAAAERPRVVSAPR
jgi:hypothetical protein